MIEFLYEITFAAYAASRSSNVFVSTVFHDGAAWCVVRCGSIFAVFLFLDGFFHGASPGSPLKFADLLWCHRSTLWLCDSTLQVRLFLLSVCLCVWVFWSVMIRLFILELMSQFPIPLHSAACLSWMWSVGSTMQISPFFNAKALQDYCFCEFVDYNWRY